MLYNEILEPEQYASIFSDILLSKGFQRVVKLVKPVGRPFLHQNHSIDYRLQEWECEGSRPFNSIYCFCVSQKPTPRMVITYMTHTTCTTNGTDTSVIFTNHT